MLMITGELNERNGFIINNPINNSIILSDKVNEKKF